MSTSHFFATPIHHAEGKYAAIADSLYQFIVANTDEAKRNPNSPQTMHEHLFESRFDFLKWDHPLVKNLKDAFINELFHFLINETHYTQQDLSQLKFDYESWFHVSNKGAYFQSHTHPNHSWSMVYCVSPGDAEPQSPHEAGKLLFIDPRVTASMYLDPANINLKRATSFNGYKITMKPGSMLIFPSFLQHSVEPYNGEKQRITVAANFRFF